MANNQEESEVTMEIFVLDLPFRHIGKVVDISSKPSDLEATSYREETVEEPRNFDELWQT